MEKVDDWDQYIYLSNGILNGPASLEDLKILSARSEINPEDPICKVGDTKWIQFHELVPNSVPPIPQVFVPQGAALVLALSPLIAIFVAAIYIKLWLAVGLGSQWEPIKYLEQVHTSAFSFFVMIWIYSISKDQERMKNAGLKFQVKFRSMLLPPVYLYLRGVHLSRVYAKTWGRVLDFV